MVQERPKCPTCQRLLPIEEADAQTRTRRVFSVSEPINEVPLSHVLEDLHPTWAPLMPGTIPEEMGKMNGWKYWLLISILTYVQAQDIKPAEEGG